jgi:aspartate 1-decarboxylase
MQLTGRRSFANRIKSNATHPVSRAGRQYQKSLKTNGSVQNPIFIDKSRLSVLCDIKDQIMESKMLRQILLSKLHRATVKECDINYNGSIKIDEELLEASGMQEFERVEVFNITNGNRFSTYIIKGERGSGMIGINGAAARLAHEGDRIIVINYGMLDAAELATHKPRILILNENNRIDSII